MPRPRKLKRPPMPGAGRPKRECAKRLGLELNAEELRRLEWLQVELRLNPSEVLRVLIADAYDAARQDR